MNNPRFSIITITFNSEKTVERTLKSVLAQTYIDFEYIIVDGASKDSTMEIVRKYEPLFNGRMKVKSEPDKGIYDAMNKGILRSTGSVIGIVNSDDWLEPDALENVNRVFEENDCSEDKIYTGGINFIYENGKINVLMPNLKKLQKMSKLYIMGGIRHPATFVPKKIYDELGLFDTRIKIAADQDLILRFFFAKRKFVAINKVISNMSDGGASNINMPFLTGKKRADKKIIISNHCNSRIKRFFVFLFCDVKTCVKYIAKKSNIYKIS